jgi:hypothetical protein
LLVGILHQEPSGGIRIPNLLRGFALLSFSFPTFSQRRTQASGPDVVTEDLISGVAGNGEAHIVLCALFGRGAKVGGFGTC